MVSTGATAVIMHLLGYIIVNFFRSDGRSAITGGFNKFYYILGISSFTSIIIVSLYDNLKAFIYKYFSLKSLTNYMRIYAQVFVLGVITWYLIAAALNINQ